MDKLHTLLAVRVRWESHLVSVEHSLTLRDLTDYIWVVDPPNRKASVTRLLQPHTTENLHPGLPRKGISGSDHVSLAAEVQWEVD